MGKKVFATAIPALLLPYLALFAMATVFFSTDSAFFKLIMESVFRNNALYLIAALLIYCLLATVLSVVCFILSISGKWDAVSLAKTAMIVKLIQVPAYILIFVVGAISVITIFTIPFSVGLSLLDCLSVFLSGLLTIAAVINAVRRGDFPFKHIFWIIILQFVFCADVVASIVLYKKLKKCNTQA